MTSTVDLTVPLTALILTVPVVVWLVYGFGAHIEDGRKRVAIRRKARRLRAIDRHSNWWYTLTDIANALRAPVGVKQLVQARAADWTARREVEGRRSIAAHFPRGWVPVLPVGVPDSKRRPANTKAKARRSRPAVSGTAREHVDVPF